MNAPLPYGRQSLGPEEAALIQEVLASDWLTQGPRVPAFEENLASLCGAPHAVAVANGTAALYLACRSAGLGPGDRFLTTPLTFAATANAGVLCGAEPVFCDIDPQTACLDAARAAQMLEDDPSLRVVVPVHFAGLVCDLETLFAATVRHGAVIIEDACHAIGGNWRGTDRTPHTVGDCAFSAMTCFSFHPVKTITTGEGGAITTRDAGLAARLRNLRGHGITRDPERMRENHGPWYYEMQTLGINARLSDLQAALGLAQLGKLSGFCARRRELVARYEAALADIPQITVLAPPPGQEEICRHLMVVRTAERDELFAHLQRAQIKVQVHYIPLHLQPYYRDRFGTGPGDFPEAERYYAEAMSLPLFPGMTDADLIRVVTAIAEFFGKRSAPKP